MKSGRRKYKLRTYILSCIERKNKKGVVFLIYIYFFQEIKCLVMLPLKMKTTTTTTKRAVLPASFHVPFFFPVL